MKNILKVCRKSSRTILSLMSGTSHDGVDAVIARIVERDNKLKVQLLFHYPHPYTNALRAKILTAFSGTTKDICRLNFELGEVFADAALNCIKKAGLSPKGIDVIASHGQTIYHLPPEGRAGGSTLQIGESSVIAERTKIPVVSDFRTRDMAAGGHGAPLVPLADYMLFHEKGAVKAVQNIGGIANLTVVPEKINKVRAFDTGPGMSLIDEAVKLLTKGRMHYDVNGALAKKGKAITPLLEELLSHPYFKKHPPKSTGRETFGKAMVKEIITGYGNVLVEDILSTLTRFTAISIQRAYHDFVFPEFKVAEIILCGGGCKNKFLLTLLKDLLAPVMLTPVEKYGIPYKAKEALSFAILANETLSGRAGNIQGATGAKHPVILGKITP